MSELSQGVKELKEKLGVPEETPEAPAVEPEPEPVPAPAPEPKPEEKPAEPELAPVEVPPEEPEEPEAELPDWAKTAEGAPIYENEKEFEVANFLAGGEKPDWYVKGYDKFTEDEKSAFGKIHSAHDKWENQQKVKETPEAAPTATPQASVEPEGMKAARERLEYIEKNEPELYKRLQSVLDQDAAPTPSAPAVDMTALKKAHADAIMENDEVKIAETFDALTTGIEAKVLNKVTEVLDKRDEQRTEQQKQAEWNNTVKTWNSQIEEIRGSGDVRINQYTQIGSDGTHTIARLLVHGDTISGFHPKSVYEAYRFLLEGGRNGRNGSALKRPDFGAMNPPQGNLNESEVAPDKTKMTTMSRREWMKTWKGWDKT